MNLFEVKTDNKQDCIMSLMPFHLYAFGDLENSKNFNFVQRLVFSTTSTSKQKTFARSSIICDLFFIDDAALVATSIEEVQKSIDRFSMTSQYFGL